MNGNLQLCNFCFYPLELGSLCSEPVSPSFHTKSPHAMGSWPTNFLWDNQKHSDSGGKPVCCHRSFLPIHVANFDSSFSFSSVIFLGKPSLGPLTVKSPSYGLSEYCYLRWGSLKAEPEAGMCGDLWFIEGRKEARQRWRSCCTGRWHCVLASAWSREELWRADRTAESVLSLGRCGRGLLYSLLPVTMTGYRLQGGWTSKHFLPPEKSIDNTLDMLRL